MFSINDGVLKMKLKNNLTISLAIGEQSEKPRLRVLDEFGTNVTRQFITPDRLSMVHIGVEEFITFAQEVANYTKPYPSFIQGNSLFDKDSFLGHMIQLRAVGFPSESDTEILVGVVKALNQLCEKDDTDYHLPLQKMSFKLGEAIYTLLFVTSKAATVYNLHVDRIEKGLRDTFKKKYGDLHVEHNSLTDEEIAFLQSSGAGVDEELEKFKSLKGSLTEKLFGEYN